MLARSNYGAVVLALVAVIAASACGRDSLLDPPPQAPDDRIPSELVIVAGDSQAGLPGDILSTLIVGVRDQRGAWMPSVEVTFDVGSGDGHIIGAQQVRTGAPGTAMVTWSLGPTPGENTLLARVGESLSVTFAARAFGGDRYDLVEVAGWPADEIGAGGFVILEEGLYLAQFGDWWWGMCRTHGSYELEGSAVTFTNGDHTKCSVFTDATSATLEDDKLSVAQESGAEAIHWIFVREAGDAAASRF
jgi:hypothetical protein